MRFKSGLFPPFLSFLFLLFSAQISLIIADSSNQHSNQNSLDDPFIWVEMLGSSDWIEREESAEKLLEAGEASVEALRTALTHPDLEVRERVFADGALILHVVVGADGHIHDDVLFTVNDLEALVDG